MSERRIGGTREDGRNVHPLIGLLEGEAAEQRVSFPAKQRFEPAPGGKGRPSFAPADGKNPSYYGLPVVKEPVWEWMIPAYFFVGGLAGASATLAGAAVVARDPRLERLGYRARWTAAAGTAISAGLLIADLGRPERFILMLRVFRPTSPMNVGTWILSGAGAGTGTAAAATLLPRRFAPVGDAAALSGAVFGLPLAAYTAVLVTNSVIPVWKGARRTLPVLFVGSAVASAAALLDLLPVTPRETGVLRRMGEAGKMLELAGGRAVMREVTHGSPRAAEPLRKGLSGALWRGAEILTFSSLVLGLTGGRRTRRIAALLALAGSAMVRFAVHEAGKASAADPQATFEQQRLRRDVLERGAERAREEERTAFHAGAPEEAGAPVPAG